MSRPGDAIGVRPTTDGVAVLDGRVEPVAPDRFERLFVYGLFAVLGAGLLYYVWEFGRNVPFWDDWRLMSVLAGREPVDLSWVWFQNNQHRYPVTRLVVLAVWRLTGDLRAVMALTCLVLCGVALAMIRTARAVRGRTSYADAFFPLVLLSWGHFENLIFATQLFFVTPVALSCGVMLVAARDRWRGNLRAVLVIGAMLILIPLHGAMGLVLAIPTSVWVAVAGIARWRDGDGAGRRDARLLLGFAAATVALVVAYFVGFHGDQSQPPSPGLTATVRTALEVLSLGLGGAGRTYWLVRSLVLLGVLALGLALAGAHAFAFSAGRLRALSLVCILCAYAGLILAIANGRSGFGAGQGLSSRYAIFASGTLCMAYFAILIYAPKDLGRFARTCLFALACMALPGGVWDGEVYGRDRAARADALLRDAARGAPTALLAKRNVNLIYPDEATLADGFQLLREAGSLPGSARSEESCARSDVVEPSVVLTHDLAWEGARGVATGADPYVVFALPEARYVCSIEVTFTLMKPSAAPATLEAFWMHEGVNDFAPGARSEVTSVPSSPGEQTLTIWIADTIDHIRLDPDAAPCEVSIERMVVASR